MNVRRAPALVMLAAALALGSCSNDNPSAEELAAEARDTAADAAQRTEELAEQAGEAAGDAADQAEDIAQDVSDGADSGTPSLEIAGPDDGASVTAADVRLTVKTTGVTIVAADGDTSGDTAHFHVFVDRDPTPVGEVIPKEPGIIHSTDNPIPVPGLAPGKHKLTVVYGDGTHKRIHADAEDTIEITVT
jgi:hypothetical protein